jgi:hypothetical protein
MNNTTSLKYHFHLFSHSPYLYLFLPFVITITDLGNGGPFLRARIADGWVHLGSLVVFCLSGFVYFFVFIYLYFHRKLPRRRLLVRGTLHARHDQ